MALGLNLFGGMVGTLIWTAAALTVMTIAAFFTWKYWRTISYKLGISTWPIDMVIFNLSGGKPIISKDKARRLTNTDKGMEKMQLLNRREEIEPISKENMYPKKNGGYTAIVQNTGKEEYNTLNLNTEMNALSAKQKQMNQWGLFRIKQEIDTWDNRQDPWWQSKGAIWISAGMFLLLALIGAAYYQSTVAESFLKAARKLSSAGG